ncbi:MAG: ABC transporter permease [Lachnospiraceae bacterium]|nr:ABC transporter permease [Lachnospiraceae bacterium]
MEQKKISAMKQWQEFTIEYFQIMMGDKKNLFVSLMFPVLAAIIVIWIAGENMFVHYDGTKSGSFVVVSAAIWGGLFNSIQIIVKDRKNIKRNYVAGARLRCYTASRAILQFVLCVLQSVILTLSYIGISVIYDNELPKEGIIFQSPLPEFFISILLLMYAADMLGLMISCMVKKEEAANVLAPYILIVQLIFSGILFAMEGLANSISYIMVSRWGMEALGSIARLNDLQLKIQLEVPSVPHEFEGQFEATKEHLLQVWGILLIFILVLVIVGNLLLHRVSKDTRE